MIDLDHGVVIESMSLITQPKWQSCFRSCILYFYPGSVLRWGRGGGTGPPNVGQAPPPNILVPTGKIRILKI